MRQPSYSSVVRAVFWIACGLFVESLENTRCADSSDRHLLTLLYADSWLLLTDYEMQLYKQKIQTGSVENLDP